MKFTPVLFGESKVNWFGDSLEQEANREIAIIFTISRLIFFIQ